MTVPFRLQLATCITDAIKAVTPANGFTNDLSDFDSGGGIIMPRVFRGRPWFGANDPPTMVSILEGTSPSDEIYAAEVDDTTGGFIWQLLVQGFVVDDSVNPTDPAYYLERDVRRVLMREKRRVKPGMRTIDPFAVSTWAPPNCGIISMHLGPAVVRPADDISAKAYFWMPLTIGIVEDLEAP